MQSSKLICEREYNKIIICMVNFTRCIARNVIINSMEFLNMSLAVQHCLYNIEATSFNRVKVQQIKFSTLLKKAICNIWTEDSDKSVFSRKCYTFKKDSLKKKGTLKFNQILSLNVFGIILTAVIIGRKLSLCKEKIILKIVVDIHWCFH